MGSGMSMALGDIAHWRGKGRFLPHNNSSAAISDNVDNDCGTNSGDGSISPRFAVTTAVPASLL